MLGGVKSKIDEALLGYREISIHPDEYKPLNLDQVRSATDKIDRRLTQYVNQIYSQVAGLLDQAFEAAVSNPVSDVSAKAAVDALLKTENDEGRSKIANRYSEVLKAVSVGYHLACSDVSRVGENPPVATVLHLEALSKVGERFSDDVRWAAHFCAHQIFYFARFGGELE